VPLTPVGEGLWIRDGSVVRFLGMPFTTRMSVVRLSDGGLWIHSPERLDDTLRDELAALGPVRHLISPNKLHHLFLQPWLEAWPDALSHAAPGLEAKRPDLRFDRRLGDEADPAWAGLIDQRVFRGSRVMEEVVFFHRPSRTLVLTDLIENFPAAGLNRWQRLLARLVGILAPHGRTPVDWRLTFTPAGRREARRCLEVMRGWAPENIIVSHGECILGGGAVFLERSFRWLAP